MVSAATAAAPAKAAVMATLAAMKCLAFIPLSRCLDSARHLTILSSDDGLHGVRANRPRAWRQALPAGLSREAGALVRAGARAHRRHRADLLPQRLRPGAPRRAEAAELRR